LTAGRITVVGTTGTGAADGSTEDLNLECCQIKKRWHD